MRSCGESSRDEHGLGKRFVTSRSKALLCAEMTPTTPQNLRPLERCVLAMRERGMTFDEIGSRIKRSPSHVERILSWTEIPRSRPAPRRSARALERRVLALRARGETHEEIGARFHKGADFIRRVEGLAHYRLAMDILG